MFYYSKSQLWEVWEGSGSLVVSDALQELFLGLIFGVVLNIMSLFGSSWSPEESPGVFPGITILSRQTRLVIHRVSRSALGIEIVSFRCQL